MGKVISVNNHKGGVGKTTTVVNLSKCLANKGYKVCAVDFDAQANLTDTFGLNDAETNIYNSMLGETDGLIPYKCDNLDVVPSSLELAAVEHELSGKAGREIRFKHLIESIKDNYDYIVVDNQPSLGFFAISSLAASDCFLIPIQAEYYAAKGIATLLTTVKDVKQYLNPQLTLLGIALTMYDARTVLHKDIKSSIELEHGDVVFESTIRKNIAIAEAQIQKQTITDYDKSSNGAADYIKLTDEIMARLSEKQKTVTLAGQAV